jgi:hypothetical protein
MEDNGMTESAEVPNFGSRELGNGSELLASFQRFMWGENVARSRKQSGHSQAKAMGAQSRHGARVGECGCEGDSLVFAQNSHFVRTVVRWENYFVLSSRIYFVQSESYGLWPHLRVFEFWIKEDLKSSVFLTLDDVEKHLNGAADLLVLQGPDLKNLRKSTLKRLFDVKSKGTLSNYVLEFHYVDSGQEEFPSIEKNIRWTPYVKNGKLLFQEFLRIQFSNIETLEEVLP